ncbi:SprT family zinc-dependent metalloprotease [Marinomonas sp. A3A]|jgi:SprT protein|uniref:SprT family zinc-dependent metalloprotease n=1 Tax=Marinomonas TaxID=28253 RepID=UPI001BB316A1|nr:MULTISPECIES: SprT family zinc-dependent metalloprotease [Marinomonas]QUX91866.1 SprT family zinc-dependent metalloprotease [Marinomonas sp. A3A]
MSLTSRQTSLNYEEEALSVIAQTANHCFDKADAFFGNKFKRSTCNLKQRGRAAGTAHLQKNELRFNHFMYQQDPVEFLGTVVPHEVAHIVVFQIYGNTVKPHGKEWQAVMLKVYGIRPSRTHTFDVPPQKQAYEYRCSCQKHQFTKRRHTRAQSGVEYICKGCRSTLQFISKDN